MDFSNLNYDGKEREYDRLAENAPHVLTHEHKLRLVEKRLSKGGSLLESLNKLGLLKENTPLTNIIDEKDDTLEMFDAGLNKLFEDIKKHNEELKKLSSTYKR
ncbi:hypothetical protein D8Y20_13465 [Mariprofundus sp. EBB-1]|uniref:hypothetical protein n=1 Tax=Mariprofundus sp. EBB-1 TaxID=2650971 RepID=UPI000EF1AA0C|nr:hypothetical protein [Mariprofundus sp. EBB-1]RLL48963.1 hypothetical protein D8Y20_13465 [Mariprofundus sp. EBB-1]